MEQQFPSAPEHTPEGGQATDLFLSLTPEKVLAAVEAAGLRCNPVCYPLNSFENRVYEVELEDRSRVVAKFYRPGRWSEEAILEEHQFLADLDAEELPITPVRPFPDGSTLKRIEHIHYAISDRKGGRAPDELSDIQLQRLGRLVARIHIVGAARPVLHRRPLTPETYVHRPLDLLLERRLVPETYRQRYRAAAEAIADIANERFQGVPTQRIHGDLHLGNVLDRDGELRILDFDDMAAGPCIQDLWLAVPGRDPESQRQREVLLSAYGELRDLDRNHLGLIEPLRGLRMVRYTGWLAKRWNDPAFRLAWPDFGTEEYWNNETRDLEDQLAAIRGEPSSWVQIDSSAADADDTEAEDPSTFTNKDYFWDWEEN